jgi:hypothetical protein
VPAAVLADAAPLHDVRRVAAERLVRVAAQLPVVGVLAGVQWAAQELTSSRSPALSMSSISLSIHARAAAAPQSFGLLCHTYRKPKNSAMEEKLRFASWAERILDALPVRTTRGALEPSASQPLRVDTRRSAPKPRRGSHDLRR